MVVESLHDMADIERASALFADIWGTGADGAHIPPELGKALVHAGNYATAARTPDGELVGALVGFLGREPDGYHSGVVTAAQVGSRYRFRLSAGRLAPDPAATHEPVVQVYGARCRGLLGFVGMHTWIAVKRRGASSFAASTSSARASSRPTLRHATREARQAPPAVGSA